MTKKILITGSAGFIGFHLTKRLLDSGYELIGFDNLNSYYDIQLKQERLNQLNKLSIENNYYWKFIKGNLEDKEKMIRLFKEFKPSIIVHLAAQAGVRYSIVNPEAYLKANIFGFQNILHCSEKYNIENLIYASSSSVYGGNTKTPFSESDQVNHPVSLYAASKKANELFAHVYSHLYNIPSTALRFFTVYGPWGRPDMAPMIFTKAIIEKKPIRIFNNGDMQRDFTYIDDVVEAVIRCAFKFSTPNPPLSIAEENASHSYAPHRIFNVGNSKPVELLKFIELIEKNLGKKANKIMMPIQSGDVKETLSDSSALETWIDYKPSTTIEQGIAKFIEWYKSYFSV